jgi:hypothetical protein
VMRRKPFRREGRKNIKDNDKCSLSEQAGYPPEIGSDNYY